MSTIPCCGDSCEDSSVSIKQGTPDSEDSCADCPPLLACGTCGGFVFQTTNFYFQPTVIENENNITPFTGGAIMNWPIEFWQPPKLA